jgi:hypothetical protein
MDMPQVNKVSANWEGWKNFMSQAVEFAAELGVSSDQITTLAHKIGNILAEPVTYVVMPLRALIYKGWLCQIHFFFLKKNNITMLTTAMKISTTG